MAEDGFGQIEHLWEGLPSWEPVVRAFDTLMRALPAAEACGCRSLSGATTYPDADVISVSEAICFENLNKLSASRPIWIGPEQLLALPDFEREGAEQDDDASLIAEEALDYARELRLPFDNVFLDFSSDDGPAVLSRDYQSRRKEEGHRASAILQAALVAQVPGQGHPGAFYPDGALIVQPFGAALRLVERNGKTTWGYPLHDERTSVPRAASLGYVQFGPPPFGLDPTDVRPRVVLGETHMYGASSPPRPMFTLMHVFPIALSDHWVAHVNVGTGALTANSLRALERRPEGLELGVFALDHEERQDLLSQALVVAYQAEQALKALYLIDSANVTLEERRVSRQVRRAVQRSGGRRKIALTVAIRMGRSVRKSPARPAGKRRDYSHAFERRGSHHHITKGSHAKLEKMKPCPQWRSRHPWSELCRREYHPPAVVGAAEGRPFVPKKRELRGDQDVEQ